MGFGNDDAGGRIGEQQIDDRVDVVGVRRKIFVQALPPFVAVVMDGRAGLFAVNFQGGHHAIRLHRAELLHEGRDVSSSVSGDIDPCRWIITHNLIGEVIAMTLHQAHIQPRVPRQSVEQNAYVRPDGRIKNVDGHAHALSRYIRVGNAIP